MPSRSSQEFTDLIGFVDQLVGIHRRLQTGPGRRHQQDAIHRAGVVMVIAAWESYVEKVVLEGLGAIEQNAGIGAPAPVAPMPPWAKHAFGVRRTQIKNSTKRFHTPSAANVRDLFDEALDFDPLPHWSWRVGPRQWDEPETRRRLNQWVDIRHSVAHGFPLPGDIPWLRDPHGRPRLTLGLLNECKGLFQRLVAQTDTSFAAFLRDHHGIPLPW